ncbi:8-oxo-dGTP pyrophosphatase MutT, NUDIX family [Mameliella alba]|nr:8-oxo-dGTP pyrophosphatase MutT (NUDIX family) [Mameliella alba]SDD63758.1 8-oxo-dGTP pyrophosphatase MutT, NUDIX family [Mameliella alba]
MTAGSTIRGGIIRKLFSLIRKTGAEFALPMLQRPRQLQTAALCYRIDDGHKRVLLITSRGTGRWVIPKGWLMRGKNASEAAVVEAWEEAGVRPGRTAERPIGTYVYDKIKNSGLPVTVEMLVFPVEVRSLEDRFPEARERVRRWVTPTEAAGMVDEPGLRQILLDFGDN